MPQLVHLSLRSYYHPMQSIIPAEEKGVTYLDTYYDQAHFVKLFKTFYGDTPRRVFIE